MPIIRTSNCGKLCALCGECAHSLPPDSPASQQLQQDKNYRHWNAVGSPDDGHKNARNMLRYYWLPINHHLLHLVGLSFTYVLFIIWPANIFFSVRDFVLEPKRLFTGCLVFQKQQNISGWNFGETLFMFELVETPFLTLLDRVVKWD